ncbi:MAG: 4Fe-4S binding protein [Bacillota bacterium]
MNNTIANKIEKGIKNNFIKKYAWIFTISVAFGGLYFPLLGLLVLPVMLGLTLTALFKGRFWCGNICPHGSLFDNIFAPLSKNKEIPGFLKTKFAKILMFTFFSFQFGRRIIHITSHFGQFSFWEKLGYIFVITYLVVTVVGGLSAVFISPRTWCQICPMGTIQMASYKLGGVLTLNKNTDRLITMDSPEKCKECSFCSKSCPMGLEPYKQLDENGQFTNPECIKCGKCAAGCPISVLSMKNISRDNAGLKYGEEVG